VISAEEVYELPLWSSDLASGDQAGSGGESAVADCVVRGDREAVLTLTRQCHISAVEVPARTT
jgi:hypothetical protein